MLHFVIYNFVCSVSHLDENLSWKKQMLFFSVEPLRSGSWIIDGGVNGVSIRFIKSSLFIDHWQKVCVLLLCSAWGYPLTGVVGVFQAFFYIYFFLQFYCYYFSNHSNLFPNRWKKRKRLQDSLYFTPLITDTDKNFLKQYF